ncbi:hypothetical protein KXV37_003016 [Aspergillus fumigatus]|nr:hypothetical protein KXV37_003016 [Aspergillus fumigatus]
MQRSCYTCRRRHVECTMVQPPCKKCKKAGLECFEQRPLRWAEGATYRGKTRTSSAKKDVPSSAAGANPRTTRTGGQTLSKSRNLSLIAGADLKDALEAFNVSIPSSLDDPSIIGLERSSRYYLYYYSKCVCKLFIMYDSNRNPLRNLIPAALAHPVLLMSILALSARHKANAARPFYQSESARPSGLGSQDDSYNALYFKCNAIQRLARALGAARPYHKDIIAASAFLLIFLDLLESGSDKWNFHLEGIKGLIAQIPSPQAPRTIASHDLGTTIQGLRDFILRQIYLIDTFGATFTRPRLLSCSTLPSQSVTPLEMSVDRAFLGCPDQILGALRVFSTSRDIFMRSDRSDTVDLYPCMQEVRMMLDSTQSFDCHTWASSLLQPHSSAESLGMLEKVAQSYKLGALIYGKRVFDALTGDTSPHHDLACDLIHAIDALRSSDSLFKCILWPLFVAGLESQQEAHRHFVATCLEKFWFETKCLNAVNAGMILRRFWKRDDSGNTSSTQWIFNIGQVEGDWLLI